MVNVRIIPRLDIKGPNLVKGIHLEGLRVLGKPEKFAKYYYENGADELIYADVVASLYNRNSLHTFIEKTAKEIFIPLTVSGGIRTIDDIRAVLRAGADKVSLNTAAIKNPNIIKEASKEFGSSTILITIEATKEKNGNDLVYTDNGREYTGIDAVIWAKKAEELGAGEIVITSVDNEGRGEGFDIELIKSISSAVSVPVIAHGGCGKPEHIKEVIEKGNVFAVSIASILHYDFITKYDTLDGDYENEGNIEFLKYNKKFNKINPTELKDIKKYLNDNNIPCRF